MPLHQLWSLADDCSVILWRIDEDEPQLTVSLPLTPSEQTELAETTHPVQRIEWLACRRATQTVVEAQGLAYVGMVKDEYGKPHLNHNGAFVSISHTHGWAAAALHPTRPIGIDIEPFRQQHLRVVPRVLSVDEINHADGNLERLAVYWCAKESLYKLYGKRQLTFREHLHIEPFDDGAEWLIGHVRLPDYVAELSIHVLRTGPGLLAVAL